MNKKKKMQLEEELLNIANEKYYNTVLKVEVINKKTCKVIIEKEALKSTLDVLLPIETLKPNLNLRGL